MGTALRNILVIILVQQIVILPTLSFAKGPTKKLHRTSLNEFALPSEVKDLKKTSGSIYYSPTSRGKVLIPVHFWGEIARSGLHYIPVNTNIIKGLSMAGGPKADANLTSVKLTRNLDGSLKEYKYDLSSGGDSNSYMTKLKPGDTVFVAKSRFFENRAYYTGLIGVIATVLSSILLYREVKK